MTNAGFRVVSLDGDALARVRESGVDDWGAPAERLTGEGGEPVRCCLRDAVAGEELLLFRYEPPLPGGPYRETGAVFVHAGACAGPASPDEYPPDWRSRPQVLRAYDAHGWIHPATAVHDGTDPVGAVRRVLAEPGVVQVHSRNIAYGCYMFTLVPAGQPGQEAA